MSVKTLLLILICSTSIIYGQNANTAVNAANAAMEYANRAANTNSKNTKPFPTPTPVPNNTTIRGRVFYEDDGKPLKRGAVVFFKKDSGREPQTLTDDNGNFEISNIPAGRYFPMIISAGVVNFFSSINFENISGDGDRDALKEAMQGYQEIIADGKSNLEVKIPVKRGGAISGAVTYSDGSPATGRAIQLLRKVNGRLQPVISNFACLAISGIGSGTCNETDDRGMFRFIGIPAGEYFMRVNEPAIHGRNNSEFLGGPDRALSMVFGLGAFLNTYYPNTLEVSQAKPIKVEFGKEQKDVNITIPDWKLYKISGKVISAKDGKPVKSKIYILQKNELTANITTPSFEQYRSFVETDEEGNWSFIEIPKGDYTLLIQPYDSYGANAAMVAVNAAMNAVNVAVDSKRNSPKSSPTPNLPKGFAKMSKNLTVENSNLENVEIKVNTAAGILGTVVVPPKSESGGRLKIIAVDENENAIESGYVYFYDLNPDSNANSVKTFQIKELPKGKIKLKFEFINSNFSIKTATANGVDLLKDSVELREGQSLSNVRIVLEKKQ